MADEFLQAAVWHGSLDQANALLSTHPAEISAAGIHPAAVLGDAASIRRCLSGDAAAATRKGGPHGWDALTYLCFSRYLRLDPARSAGFLEAATALLDAGADPNTGFHDTSHQPEPEFESALYGAAGVAHHAGLTKLLLERGADPNDNEVVYHCPESYDNGALQALLTTGKLTAGSLAILLLRKHDWHDHEGARLLLQHGADPNRYTPWKRTSFHQAVRRDNALDTIQLLLDHGADPFLQMEGESGVAMAARRGRRDVLDLLEKYGFPLSLDGVDELIAACARADAGAIHAIAARAPHLVADVVAQGGRLLAGFAGVGNTEGVRCLLDLGIHPAARFAEGDGYWDVAPDSTALHVAAWRMRHDTVRLLLQRGAPVDAPDARSRTPLALALRACVDSYWAERRSTESIEALLEAGASPGAVPYPSGYTEADALLERHRAGD